MIKMLADRMNRSILQIGQTTVMNTTTDTGRLKSSILGGSYSASKSHSAGSFAKNYCAGLASSNRLTASIGSDVEYAVFVHEGTKFMRGRPFLANAVKSEEQFVDREFEKAVQDTLDEIGRAV